MSITSESNVLVTGYKCEVWAGESATSAIKVGMVDSFTASKNLQTQRAQVIGTIMPVSIDPQALSASISMSGFIAKKEIVKAAKYGKGDATINAFCPDDGIYTKETVTKIPYVCLKDKTKGEVLCTLEYAIPTSYQVQSQGQSYIKANIQMEAITMNIGTAYQDDSFGLQ
ncbi:MAG: hypothetical protein MJ176_03380 [Treponema sp.]|nr:hypothetical protein [Treponema sp.]